MLSIPFINMYLLCLKVKNDVGVRKGGDIWPSVVGKQNCKVSHLIHALTSHPHLNVRHRT